MVLLLRAKLRASPAQHTSHTCRGHLEADPAAPQSLKQDQSARNLISDRKWGNWGQQRVRRKSVLT